ncbi:LysR family transcriptional regulator [Sphingomonas oleivorans]|uniref:LysR family transcriptional regulator n=1 Tax=Sphingomonas oleivorans TaxID=1735121 RepID=A0A2T5G0L6_9SPHN|nr:LysR family transcriptional regulator [Sphingomonas oleivorans]PTQ12684.1 LysR family transcriptional regulator [Sphingomonas oleivorans]
MRGPGTPTLDQLQVFLCIVETGSFAAASRKLGRATSVISYAITNLEAQLGLTLFDRESTKRPQLTEAGRMVLSEARTIARGVDGLRARVTGMLEGLEAQVTVAVDVLLPTARLTDALTAFSAEFPTVSLRLHVEALGAVSQLVVDRAAVIGVTGPLQTQLEGLDYIGIGHVELIPVAAPHHPLAQPGGETPGASRDHVQLVLTDRSRLTEGQDFQVTALRTWRLADLGAKHALLLAGLGWGNMPEPMVRADIEAGRLVRLASPDVIGGPYPLRMVYRTDTPPGPAARWLIERLRATA